MEARDHYKGTSQCSSLLIPSSPGRLGSEKRLIQSSSVILLNFHFERLREKDIRQRCRLVFRISDYGAGRKNRGCHGIDSQGEEGQTQRGP